MDRRSVDESETQSTARRCCREDGAAPFMLGVHTAFGSLDLGNHSFLTKGCPGNNALLSYSSFPSTMSVSHLQMSDAKPHTRNRFSHAVFLDRVVELTKNNALASIMLSLTHYIMAIVYHNICEITSLT